MAVKQKVKNRRSFTKVHSFIQYTDVKTKTFETIQREEHGSMEI